MDTSFKEYFWQIASRSGDPLVLLDLGRNWTLFRIGLFWLVNTTPHIMCSQVSLSNAIKAEGKKQKIKCSLVVIFAIKKSRSFISNIHYSWGVSTLPPKLLCAFVNILQEQASPQTSLSLLISLLIPFKSCTYIISYQSI